MHPKRTSRIPLLLGAMLACGLLAGSLSAAKADFAPAPAATSLLAALRVPVQAVLVSDDDGGRPAQITPEQVGLWVAKANEIFAGTGIRFGFDPRKDFSALKSTLLNNMTGNTDPNWQQEIQFGDEVAAGYPGKLVIFFRHGPGPVPTGAAFSWRDYNFVAASGFNTTVCGYQNIGLLAHEIGHYLGLAHTFSVISSSLQQAENYLASHGNDPNAFDGDGFADTPPDPYISQFQYQCTPVASIKLNEIEFPLPRDNIMSYYEVRTGLSPQQTAFVRWMLDFRMQNAMAVPTNQGATSPLDIDAGPYSASLGCNPGRQDMSPWSAHRWIGGDQLFVGSAIGCVLKFPFQASRAGRYALELYGTRAPDFGIVAVKLDGSSLGAPLDFYAPIVTASGRILLGEVNLEAGVHTLTFEVIGKNPASTRTYFGLDALSLLAGR